MPFSTIPRIPEQRNSFQRFYEKKRFDFQVKPFLFSESIFGEMSEDSPEAAIPWVFFCGIIYPNNLLFLEGFMKYCPECGNRLKEDVIHGERVRKCENCGFIDWDNWVYVACVAVAFNDRDEFLMVRLKGKEEGKITFPGGFRNLGETLEEAAKREFHEETGMEVRDLELFNVYARDEQRLVWVVFRGKLSGGRFEMNDEVGEVFFVGRGTEINKKDFRGSLTAQLFQDLMESK